tara:strand:- start:792 stop:2510 length:1719 start_codon:yes stop_codon:yes gene_type:complete
MRLSQSLWQTFKEVPAEAEIPSHRLMLRAGLIHKSGAGIYNLLPFGLRVVQKIERIVRDELDKAGCQEILMSMVTPGELWQESGRWDLMTEMIKFKDKKNRDLCLSPTNEETVSDIFRNIVKSYKSLPATLYQINTKFRDEIRPRFGLMRAREFIMKDAYSFHNDKESLDLVYKNLYDAYCRIFERMGLEYTVVEADGGAMASSDSQTHEFQVVAETGEDEIIYCAETGYAANIEKAKTKRANAPALTGDAACEDIATPGAATIEAVAKLLKVEKHHTMKALVFECITGEESKIVVAFILGDDTLNEVKLKAATGADHVRAASESMLSSVGLVKGFIGPVGLSQKVEVLIDEAIDGEGLYVAGANKIDFHTKNIKPSRDITHATIVDLRLACSGDLTLDEKGVVAVRRGIEVGHIFQLGNKYTKAMNVTVSDVNGKPMHPLMGCYGIGITRVAAAAVEQNNDDGGIIWPAAIAPYHVYFASIAKDEEVAKMAEGLYHELQNHGLEVVFDDRKVGPGFKFKDSDLLGLPVRIVIGDKTWKEQEKIEVVWRHNGEKLLVSREELVGILKAGLKV